jgi:formylglycine-generating enzyme required for sulfatase activity
MYEVPKFSKGLKFQVRSLSIMTEYKLVSLGFDEANNYKKEKTAFENVSNGIDYTEDAKYGGVNFKAWMQQVKIAQSSVNDPEKGVQAYKAASSLFPQAMAEVTENKRLVIVSALTAARDAKAGGQLQTCAEKAREVLLLDVGNIEAKALLSSIGSILLPTEGAAWTSPETGMEFVWIDALKLWVGKYEVTNSEYRKKETAHESKDYLGHSLNSERQPVVYVDFDDAKAYAAWLTKCDNMKPSGMRYRIPSADEWLAFARCGDKREYPWGSSMPPKYGNYNKRSGYDDGYVVSCPVEKSGRNEWGIYGVGGNVWEVCSMDVTGSEYAGSRGAAWNLYDADELRCYHRTENGGTYYVYGFRLVLSR